MPMSDRPGWWIPLYPFAALVCWAIGAWAIANSFGIGVQDVMNSPTGSIGVLAVLGGQLMFIMGHKAELVVAREGREWWSQ